MPSMKAAYVASTSAGSSSVAPWMLWAGEIRSPTRSAPIASATARVTSMREAGAVLRRPAVLVGALVGARARGTGGSGSRWRRAPRPRRGRPRSRCAPRRRTPRSRPGSRRSRSRAASGRPAGRRRVTILPGAAIALGAMISWPPVLSGWAIRPACISWATIRPPLACTASATRLQPASCSGEWKPGVFEVALATCARLAALGDDQPGGGALGVVLRSRGRRGRCPARGCGSAAPSRSGWAASRRRRSGARRDQSYLVQPGGVPDHSGSAG